MPTYQYACTACDERLEVVQKFSDEPLTECPACQGRLRKVFSAVGVVFKGSGFYQTDSRASAGKGKSESTGGDKSAKSESAGATTSEAKSEGTSAAKSDKGAAATPSGSKVA